MFWWGAAACSLIYLIHVAGIKHYLKKKKKRKRGVAASYFPSFGNEFLTFLFHSKTIQVAQHKPFVFGGRSYLKKLYI